MPYQFADLAIDGPIAVVTICRPERLNGLSEELEIDLCAALLDAEADPAVRAIILAGAGRAFSAGHDLKDPRGLPPTAGDERAAMARRRASRILRATLYNQKPVIARVHGYCLGAATDMASSCDFVIASDDATFGYPVLRTTPAAPRSLWPWQIGISRAKELIFTGDVISATRAEAIGMVNHVIPRDQLDGFTYKLAMRIALGVSKGLQKQWLNNILTSQGLPAALEAVRRETGDDATDPVQGEWLAQVRRGGVQAAVQWRNARWAPYE